jgi:hypothetical protein
MRVVYNSVYSDEELQSGIPLRTVPGSGTLSVETESGDPKIEVFYNGEKLECDVNKLPAEAGAELLIKSGEERNSYTVRAFVEPLAPEFAKAYEQFYYEYSRKKDDEIVSIENGEMKLYAVDQSTEIRDWTNIFDKIEDAFPAFKAICDKPKSHLKAVNEVRPIETVKRVGYESIPYLAAHSEDWLARTASGLKPARLFSRVEDDDYQIYENRVIKTLIDLIIPFLRKREKELRDKYSQLEGIMNSSVQTGSFGFDVTFKKAVAELIKTDESADKYRSEAMDLAEMLSKRAKVLLKKYITLRNTRLYKLLRKARTVSNPLNETNILLMDKHYSVVFKLWDSIHKVLTPQERDIDRENTVREDFLNYKQFCMTLVGYAAHVMGFDIESDGNYKRNDDIGITITDIDDIIEICVRDSSRHELVVPGGVVLPIVSGEGRDKFFYDGRVLSWDNTTSSDDIEEFAGFLKPKGKPGKEQNEQRRNYTELKRLIADREHEYPKPKINKVLIIPCMIGLKSENRNQFKDYITEKASRILSESDASLAIIALPKCQEDEQKIVEYALGDEEKLLFLPLSMYDINSFRRVQNVLTRQIMEMEKETCPCCGRKMRKDVSQSICDNCSGLIITTTICPEEDCKTKYKYLGYKVSQETIDKMYSVDESNFYQRDSLYQYKNIVKMHILDHKLIAVCPRCGR